MSLIQWTFTESQQSAYWKELATLCTIAVVLHFDQASMISNHHPSLYDTIPSHKGFPSLSHTVLQRGMWTEAKGLSGQMSSSGSPESFKTINAMKIKKLSVDP